MRAIISLFLLLAMVISAHANASEQSAAPFEPTYRMDILQLIVNQANKSELTTGTVGFASSQSDAASEQELPSVLGQDPKKN